MENRKELNIANDTKTPELKPVSLIDSDNLTTIQIPFTRAVTLDYIDQAKHYNRLTYDENVLLGNGTTAEIYQGTYKFQSVAVKKYRIRENTQIEKKMQTEVFTLAELQHPYIVKSFAYSMENRCLVTELMAKGALEDVLNRKKLDWKTTIKIVWQIASALDYLHSVKNYVHGDIKSGNVLLDHLYNAKLADFETAGIEQTRFLTGTPGFHPPEIIESLIKASCTDDLNAGGIPGSENTKVADIFSFGVLLMELMLGRQRFAEDYLSVVQNMYTNKSFVDQVFTHIENIFSNLKKENEFPISFIELAETCIQKNPQTRPTSQQIVSTLTLFPELEDQVKLKYKNSKHTVTLPNFGKREIESEKKYYESAKKTRLQYAFAAAAGDIQELKKLSKAGLDPNLTDYSGVTTLMIAAHKGHVDAVSFLINLSWGCSSREAISGWTALRSTAINGNIQIAMLLLDDGANPNHIFMDDTTPIMLAARHGHSAIIELLVWTGADIDYADPRGLTALGSAIIHNQVESVLTLCKLGASPNPKQPQGCMYDPLFLAIEHRNIEIVEKLLQMGADTAPSDRPGGATALHYAAQLGYLDILTLLLKQDTKLIDNQLEAYVPVLMSKAKNKGLAKELYDFLTHNGEITLPNLLPGFTALHLAAFLNHVDILDVLLKAGAKMMATPSGISALQLATIMGNTEVVERLNQEINPAEVVSKDQGYQGKLFDGPRHLPVAHTPTAEEQPRQLVRN